MPEVNLDKCDFCGGCTAVCPSNAITVYIDFWVVDKELCNECLLCKKVCPMKAISIQKRI